jgi:hypothetical protein
MPRKNRPQFEVECIFPPPQADDEARHVALLQQMIEMGKIHAQRKKALVDQLRAALDNDDAALTRSLSQQLCELLEPKT